MRIRALLIACLVAASSLLVAVPAQAAPATVYIYKVYFDSPGSDRGSNSSLNAEYVVIRNGDNVAHSISGWTVRDRPDTSTSSATSGWELANRPSFTPARAAATPPVPARTCIGVGAGMCGTTLVTR
jgi:hypothetical protein